ncbi:MAG TPA: phenylalanine--tRNA ligase subunit alpha [Nitrosopumilaceae archaeon]|nr:phenylalanine--tRNA ligase subunit alpha [Nitrosopumilaceae archaeon]
MSKVLHPIEHKIIKTLKETPNITYDEIAKNTQLAIDQVRRGVEWLKHKNLVAIHESEVFFASLGENGKKAAEKGLPERRLVNHLTKHKVCTFEEARTAVLEEEFNAAISNARQNGWIEITKGETSNIITLKDNIKNSSEEELLSILVNKTPISEIKNKSAFESLKKRPNFILLDSIKTTTINLTKQGLDTPITQTKSQSTDVILVRAIDVEAPAPEVFAARSHPLQDIINEVREIFVSLGFAEICGNLAQPGFWNFDALFTPQDHPAREMQDTFYIKDASANKFATPNQIAKVSESHKKGWHYDWKLDEAKRMVLRTHTTCVTIKHLADNNPDEARVFSVGRVFRNEKVSYKHLVEFNQVEGVVVGKNVTLRDLMGLQREFYYKMGLKKVKFWPTFFPYTEPSLQSMVYNEKLGKWVELFGMGIFRPEVTKPLGIKNPVLAWGGGIERIAMLKFALNDVRELYNNNLGWLRSVPKCP